MCIRDRDKGVRQYLIDTYKGQVNALLPLQAPSGLWRTILTDETSYEEVSGTAAIAAVILKGIKAGILDESYQEAADKAIEAICRNVAEDGTVLNGSAGTGIGLNAENYKNIAIMPMAYGQSLALIALVCLLYTSYLCLPRSGLLCPLPRKNTLS